ncbi:hypothetical protein [Bartonella grahamii]|uniref:hypothetical protein n=1 Tax=Bartonella grahamii TaxID=33045 RepID=UPI002E7B2DEA|nr:hypothetical protein [Bartonella grahamii]
MHPSPLTDTTPDPSRGSIQTVEDALRPQRVHLECVWEAAFFGERGDVEKVGEATGCSSGVCGGLRGGRATWEAA